MTRIRSIFTFLCALILLATPLAAQGVSFPAPVGAGLLKRYPYSMAGQLIFTSGAWDYQGSGTVIYKRSVLTAAHNVWNPDTGWSTSIEFNRARSGRSSASHQFATRLFLFGGYRSVTTRYGVESSPAFASDLAGLRFSALPAGGAYAGWRADARLLGGGNPGICLGYGAELHDGDDLLAVGSGTGFFRVRGAFMESDRLTFEAGMSGGPVFVEVAPDDFRLAGVVVAGSVEPPAGGIRALDAAGAAFIRTYLQY
jgi:hypothetical protein